MKSPSSTHQSDCDVDCTEARKNNDHFQEWNQESQRKELRAPGSRWELVPDTIELGTELGWGTSA